MYWLGLRPGDIHWNISSPGWAKHAWSCVFAPWNAGATVFVYNYQRFALPHVLRVLDKLRGYHPVRSADRVANADPGEAGGDPVSFAKWLARGSRSTPK